MTQSVSACHSRPYVASNGLGRTALAINCLVIILFAAWIMRAHAQIYIAPFSEARWSAKSDPFRCSLVQAIPHFGKAQFVIATRSKEVLEIKGNKLNFEPGPVRLEAVPPAWRSETGSGYLAKIYADIKQVTVPEAELAKVTASLENGSNIIVSGANLRVGLEARNFNSAFAIYKACKKALIPYTFEQLSRTHLAYATTDTALDSNDKAQLNRISRYVNADKGVLRILIDAHAGTRPDSEESESISQRQAGLVADYLVAQGVATERITIRWHGDKFPIADNGTKAGRAKNHRVILRLENAQTRAKTEKRVAAIREAQQKAAAEKLQAGPQSSETLNVNQGSSSVEKTSSAVADASFPTSTSSSEMKVSPVAVQASASGMDRPSPSINATDLERLVEEQRF